MSEPVIKARLWCQQCGLVGRSHTIGRTHAFRIRHVVREGYTRDDLVRVAREALATWCQPGESLTGTCNTIVDRLTKGDV